MDNIIWNIIKKWAKTDNLDWVDVIDAAILVADKHNQALDQPKQATIYNNKGKLKRKSFSQEIQKLTRRKQANRCNICKERLEVINFDHIDGNSYNNLISNCQALCPNCHAKKTRKKNTKRV